MPSPDAPSPSIPSDKFHHLLGPRTAYLIGSTRVSGAHHLCAASNVTNVSISPQLIAVGLWPAWESTGNILRAGELTVNLMDSAFVDDIWIVGAKYSNVTLRPDDDKYAVGGLTPSESRVVQPACVSEAIASLECRVLRSIEDLGDHVIFLAEVVAATCDRSLFDSDFILDVYRAHPVMQISGNRFAQCEPSGTPDTAWCSAMADRRRRH